jgi:hypothetical protein
MPKHATAPMKKQEKTIISSLVAISKRGRVTLYMNIAVIPARTAPMR